MHMELNKELLSMLGGCAPGRAQLIGESIALLRYHDTWPDSDSQCLIAWFNVFCYLSWTLGILLDKIGWLACDEDVEDEVVVIVVGVRVIEEEKEEEEEKKK